MDRGYVIGRGADPAFTLDLGKLNRVDVPVPSSFRSIGFYLVPVSDLQFLGVNPAKTDFGLVVVRTHLHEAYSFDFYRLGGSQTLHVFGKFLDPAVDEIVPPEMIVDPNREYPEIVRLELPPAVKKPEDLRSQRAAFWFVDGERVIDGSPLILSVGSVQSIDWPE